MAAFITAGCTAVYGNSFHKTNRANRDNLLAFYRCADPKTLLPKAWSLLMSANPLPTGRYSTNWMPIRTEQLKPAMARRRHITPARWGRPSAAAARCRHGRPRHIRQHRPATVGQARQPRCHGGAAGHPSTHSKTTTKRSSWLWRRMPPIQRRCVCSSGTGLGSTVTAITASKR